MSLIENGQVIHSLIFSFNQGSVSISNIPSLVKRILREEMWRNFVVEDTSKEIEYESFQGFVETSIPDGLGTTMDDLRRVCRDDDEVLDLIDRVMQRPVGGNNPSGSNQYVESRVDDVNNVNVIHSGRPMGNTKEAGLRRLRKDRPDLHKEVIDGDKSVNAACIEAGFRKSPLTPLGTLKKTWVKATDSDKEEFLEWIKSEFSV